MLDVVVNSNTATAEEHVNSSTASKCQRAKIADASSPQRLQARSHLVVDVNAVGRHHGKNLFSQDTSAHPMA